MTTEARVMAHPSSPTESGDGHAARSSPSPSPEGCDASLTTSEHSPATDPITALDTARRAQLAWTVHSLPQRLAIVKKARELLVARAEAIAQTVAQIRRCPVTEALVSEVIPLADAMRFLERRAESILSPVKTSWRDRPFWLAGSQLEIVREPLGVVLILAPSNYPLLLSGAQAIQALVAGNAVIVKPAPGTEMAMQQFRSLLIDAGLPAALSGLLPVEVAAAQSVIEAGVDRIVLTGSGETGRAVLQQSARNLTPTTMELSGCDAVFVLPDADLTLVVRALKFGLSLNHGATCIAPRRVFVDREHYATLQRDLIDAIADLSARPISDRQLSSLRHAVDDALSRGARLLTGTLHTRDTITPILLADDSGQSMLLHDCMGPVLSLTPVDSAEHALHLSKRCTLALGAAIFGPETQARELAPHIDAGVVVINDLIVPTADPRLPFSGRGSSGFGVTRGAEGLLEMTQLKAITTRQKSPGAWAHLDPASPHDQSLFLAYLRLAHAPWRHKLSALFALVRAARARLNDSSTQSTTHPSWKKSG